MIKTIFLGTSDAIPDANRSHTSILLIYEGEQILIDCGEGTQRQFRKAGLNPLKVTRILISHWHGDHVLGIPGLLQTLAFSGYNKTLYIYGPKGTKKYIQELIKSFVFVNKFSIKVEEVANGKFLETKDFYIESRKMTHGPPCNAYSFVKKGNLKIDKKKLEKFKISEGVHLQKLKEGKNLTFNGKKYLAKNLTYRDNDKKISFVLDTSYNKDILPFVKNSNILISEATFSKEDAEKAREHKHMTTEQAAEIAKKANAEKLILTHLSQRYSKNPEKILSEAKKIFKNSHLAKDLEEFDLN